MGLLAKSREVSLPGGLLQVPKGFRLTPQAFQVFLEESGLKPELLKAFGQVDQSEPNSVMIVSFKVRKLVTRAELPASLSQELEEAYQQLAEQPKPPVVVKRADAADLQVRGLEELVEAIRSSFAAGLTQRVHQRFYDEGVDSLTPIELEVQRLVEVTRSGLAYTFDPKSGCHDLLAVYATWGLAEDLARKTLTRDEFLVHRERLQNGFPALLSSKAQAKEFCLHYDPSTHRLQHLPISAAKARRFL